MRLVGKALRKLGERLDPPRPEKVMRGNRVDYAPTLTLFERDEDKALQRNEDAMTLVDPETLGYVLVRAVRSGACVIIQLGVALDDQLWPAMTETLGRVVIESDRIRAATS